MIPWVWERLDCVCMDLRGSMLALTPARGLEFDFCFRDSAKKKRMQIRLDQMGAAHLEVHPFRQIYMYSSGYIYLFGTIECDSSQ